METLNLNTSTLFPSIDDIDTLDAEGVARILDSLVMFNINEDQPAIRYLGDIAALFKIDPKSATEEMLSNAKVAYYDLYVVFLGHEEKHQDAMIPEDLQPQAIEFLTQLMRVLIQLYGHRFNKKSGVSKLKERIISLVKGNGIKDSISEES